MMVPRSLKHLISAAKSHVVSWSKSRSEASSKIIVGKVLEEK